MPSLLTEGELAARTGIKVGTLKNWRTRRKAGEEIGPPFVKVGGKLVRYRIGDVEHWEAGLREDGEAA